MRPTPTNQVSGQQGKPDGCEVLLEVEEAKDMPVTRALQLGPASSVAPIDKLSVVIVILAVQMIYHGVVGDLK